MESPSKMSPFVLCGFLCSPLFWGCTDSGGNSGLRTDDTPAERHEEQGRERGAGAINTTGPALIDDLKARSAAQDVLRSPNSLEIADRDIRAGRKYQLDLVLAERLSETDLEAISLELRPERSYPRVFLRFFLRRQPFSDVSCGGAHVSTESDLYVWAIVEFAPHYDARIQGFTPAGLVGAVKQSSEGATEVLGSWLDADVPETVRTILRIDQTWHSRTHIAGIGPGWQKELISLPQAGNERRFRVLANPTETIHISSDDTLRLMDDQGVVLCGKPVGAKSE